MIDAHYKQSIAECNSNHLLGLPGMLWDMGEDRTTARQLVAKNLARLMAGSPSLNTQEKVGSKAGIKQRTVGYLLNPESADMKSPKLDTVEKVAQAFGLEPWVLLVDPDTFGEELTKMLRRPVTTDDRLEELGMQAPTGKPPTVKGRRGGKKRSLV